MTVLSGDLRDNVAAKVRPSKQSDIRVIPNFVDTDFIRPHDRMTALRSELGIGAETVVLYAGNVGFSQSLEMVVEAAQSDAIADVSDQRRRRGTRLAAAPSPMGCANVRFSGYQPVDRLPEVLATGDIHLVPLKAGLGRVSVPSKTYSILAAGRPVLAAIDPGTEVPRIVAESRRGVCVPPDDLDAFRGALQRLADDPAAAQRDGGSPGGDGSSRRPRLPPSPGPMRT